MPILKNSKHEAFAHGVAKGLSATQAYIDAGYSENGARCHASRLATKGNVSARIEEIKVNIGKSLEQKVGVSKAYVIDSLRQVAQRCMQAEPVFDRDGNETGEYTFQHAGANKALELIGKELGMFRERMSLENPDGTATKALQVIYVGKRITSD